MIKLLFLLLSFCCLSLSAVPAVSGGRPDSAAIREIQNSFPGWKLNSSARCAVSRDNGLWAWKIVLERQIDANIKSSSARDGKGYIIIVMVPDVGIDPGRNFISLFDWNIPGNDLKQFTVFLGRGRGYYWYMKSDIARLNFFREKMRLSGGEDMDRLMADALNVTDFDLFTSRAAVEYFRNKGPQPVPLIMKSMREWQKEEKNPPVQHMIALKLTGSSAGAEELMKLSSSPDHAVAHQALKLLVEEPYLGSDSFYRRALAVPEYTGKIIRIFRERKKTDLILPRLRKLVKAPRTLQQYTEVLAALRELEKPGKADIPEYAACNDIMFLMMRMGETSDTIKYVPIEAEGAGSPSKLAEEERKRIEPHLEILRKSKDTEAVFAAAVALAAYSPDSKVIAKEYSSRVRRIGVEILRMLPADFVFAHFDMLGKSLVLPREQSLLRMIRYEYGGR
ncbi:MAG: hypothetical protein J5858_09525 [Lentisphaeria bacterium]|nr:hypothetical protein [Lentisphaeria bacterium]